MGPKWAYVLSLLILIVPDIQVQDQKSHDALESRFRKTSTFWKSVSFVVTEKARLEYDLI